MTVSPRSINIAIVGLSLSNQMALREAVGAALPEGWTPSWVNIAQPRLDLIIINTDFASASSVQKITSYNPVPLLRVDCRSAGEVNWAADTTTPSQLDRSALRQWLLHRLNGADEAPAIAALNPASPVVAAAVRPALPVPAAAVVDDSVFRKIHQRQSGRVKLFDAQGFIAVVDTAKEMVWLPNGALPKFRSLDQTFNSTHSTSHDLELVGQVPVDMRQWVWQQLLHSPAYAGLVGEDTHVSLLFWPQPESDHERRAVLRLAAAFQKGATVRQVAQKLEMPLAEVQQFAAALVGSNMGRKLDGVPVQPSAARADFADVRHTLEAGHRGGARGFFSKLRSRLGL